MAGGTISYSGVQVPLDSPLGVELQKWERPVGWNPRNHQYPKMLYKAFKGKDGTYKCMDSIPYESYLYERPELFDQAVKAANAFNSQCIRTVQSEREEKSAHSEGWRESADEAISAAKGEILTATLVAGAEFAYEVSKMSEKAQAEVRYAEANTPEVLVDMPPAAERRRPGRPRKDSAA